MSVSNFAELLKGLMTMRKMTNENLKIKDRAGDSGKKKYVRPKLVKKEKLLGATGSEIS